MAGLALHRGLQKGPVFAPALLLQTGNDKRVAHALQGKAGASVVLWRLRQHTAFLAETMNYPGVGN